LSINILDCTLRDGGYVNSFLFNNNQIKSIITNLQNAKIDIVECGFLDHDSGKESDFTRFKSCKSINKLLKDIPSESNTLKVAMIEYGKYNIHNLPKIDTSISNQINGIRFSFRKPDHLEVYSQMESIVEKGYKLFIQPIATESYTDSEIINFIQQCNQLNATAMYIVDTHGSMFRDDFRRLYYLFEHNLNPKTSLGFHSHNNLQLSYSNAIDFIEISSYSNRNIMIDASIYGMGRGAGNLNTELLANYINRRVGIKYDIDPLLEVVDKYLLSIHKNNSWGYSLEHFLSATEYCHPNYASFLINKKNLAITEIKQLLSNIPTKERREFNKNIIEQIYIAHKEKLILSIKNLNNDFFNSKILLIASGNSVKEHTNKIINRIKKELYITIGLNHIDSYIKTDYLFFSNQIRYDEFCDFIEDSNKLIITSNIKVKATHNDCYVLNYKELFNFMDIKVDNVAILLLNYFIMNSVQDIAIAGFDGYSKNSMSNYSYQECNQIIEESAISNLNRDLSDAIKKISNKIHLTYITSSMFKKFSKQKIIGIIPARYASSRLPGKPLKDICGLPMIIHVLKRAQMSKILDELYVATDDLRIYNVVEKYGGKAIMTDIKHSNATERVYEISQKIQGDLYIIINGDEPLLTPKHIDILIDKSMQLNANIAMLYNDFYKKNSPSDQKVVVNKKEEIIYISRSDIPYGYKEGVKKMHKAYFIVSFVKDFLDTYMTLENTPLSTTESNEFTKVLEHGYKIQGVKVSSSAISVDTQEDLVFVRKEMANNIIFDKYRTIID